jgi:hypothetical protein
MGTPDVAPDPVPQDAEAVPTASELLKLLTFLSPAFPVGAFSYSHGLERLIADGAVSDPEALQVWLEDLGADLDVMEADTNRMRDGRPYVFTDMLRRRGLDSVVEFIETRGGLSG